NAGRPASILDLYAEVDIPEIEGVEPLRMKMASSAGNVVGKKLVSSESATWLSEHFESNLSDIKVAIDRFLLNGINHVLYHGTAYSPPGEAWPGWLFYASIHMNPRNSIWADVDALNQYITRCQSFLQRSSADNDVLLYFPIYDRFATRGEEMVEHFDGVGKQFENTAFRRNAETMLKRGYTFDYISDAQIMKINVEDGALITESTAAYKTIVIPHCRYIPVATFEKVIALAKAGATVIITEGPPESPAGFSKLDENKKLFNDLVKQSDASAEVVAGIRETKLGQGRIIMGDSIVAALNHSSIKREVMVDQGIQFIRKKENGDRKIYLIANATDKSFEGWLPLSESSKSVAIYDPMTGEFGSARIRQASAGAAEVFVQLTKSQTLILETYKSDIGAQPFRYISEVGDPVLLNGKWKLTFLSGGTKLPPAVEMDAVSSWLAFGSDYASFSGTASYTTSFKRPATNSAGWRLDLGVVKESAEILLNGKPLATLIGPVYHCYIDKALLAEDNILEVRVSNLMANRIADLDKRGVFWKKFYNINFPARKPENRKNGLFDASEWMPRESGLIGPVRLQPVK
ncbi:MAG TPA: glycosyl hydrolase, partial [Chryseolinea sp.]